MTLFREIVLDAWKEKQQEATEFTRTLQNRLTQLKARQDQLVDAFVYRRVIDEGTYKQQKDRLDQEIALAEIAAHDAKLDELDVEAVVVFAEHVLLNAARLWQEFSLEQKQRLQQLLFPVGVTYADGEFRTVEMSPVFRMLRAIDGGGESEVSPAGFEPTLSA
jgi:uncharacterized tellurite resistance protein B-like protein